MSNEEFEEDDQLDDISSEKEDSIKTENKTFEIISYGADYTLSVLYEKLVKKEIVIPEFQRKYVWKIEQASKLVESFLLGLPVPGIFLAKEKEKESDKESGNFLVVDGQQRLRTIQAFKEGKYPLSDEQFRLIDVQDQWDGKTYKDLEPVDRKRFDDSVLRATIIRQVDPKDNTSIYHIFERLNTGGTILQNQEVRNCVYYGRFNELLHQLNVDKNWRTLYNMQLPQKRMKDEELILRFLALYYDFENYEKPMNSFLSKFMGKNRNPSPEKLQEMKDLFLKIVDFVNKSVGLDAFRPKRNLNIAAFDSIMYVIAKNNTNLKTNLKNSIIELFKNQDYIKNITEGTTDPETINNRFKLAKDFLVKNEK